MQDILFDAPAQGAVQPATTSSLLEVIANNLLATVSKVELPKAYLSDLAHDIETINEYNADFVWVLRESGTAIAPIRCGVNPKVITYWLAGNAKAFLVSNNGQTITPISFSKATELINEPPAVTFNKGREALVNEVNELLNSRSWWMWEKNEEFTDNSTAHWQGYLQGFRYHKNEIMAELMYKAIQALSELQH